MSSSTKAWSNQWALAMMVKRACRIHDIMLELIISKAAEENFITMLGNQNVVVNQQVNIRRLSTQYIDQKLTTMLASKDLCHARSLTSFVHMKCFPRLVEFEALRVLDLEDCKRLEEYDLCNTDKLFQLKYLSPRGTWISKIPSQIVKLQDLEMLDLRGTNIEELPVGIVRLTKLVYLLVGDIYFDFTVKLPDGIGNMGNLQWLSGFDICKSSTSAVEELGNLTNLKELEIRFKSGQSNIKINEMIVASLCKLDSYKLQSLGIFSINAYSLEFLDGWSPPPNGLQSFWMTTNYCFLKIPQWMVSLPNVAYLDINLNEVTEEDLHKLGELPALLSLELWLKPDLNQRLTIRSIGFSSLKEFIFNIGIFEGEGYITFDKGAMPKLERLELPFNVTIAKTDGFYLGIKHLPCLKEANILLYTRGAKYSETKAEQAAIREEANVHPNHPRVTIVGEGKEESEEERRKLF